MRALPGLAAARALRYNLGVRFVGICAVMLGCAPSGGPSQTLDQYSRAIHKRDFGESYDLMSSSFRSRVSRQNYVRMMRNTPREVEETAKRLRGTNGRLEVTAEFEYGLGDEMRLVQEGGNWKIQTDPLAFYDQSTPKAALRSFVRAYRLARWDVVLRFVPNAYRQKMDVAKIKAQFTGASKDQMELLARALEANVDQPIAERGNEARMAYAEKYEMTFVREDGIWKVKDLD